MPSDNFQKEGIGGRDNCHVHDLFGQLVTFYPYHTGEIGIIVDTQPPLVLKKADFLGVIAWLESWDYI